MLWDWKHSFLDRTGVSVNPSHCKVKARGGTPVDSYQRLLLALLSGIILKDAQELIWDNKAHKANALPTVLSLWTT